MELLWISVQNTGRLHTHLSLIFSSSEGQALLPSDGIFGFILVRICMLPLNLGILFLTLVYFGNQCLETHGASLKGPAHCTQQGHAQ